MIELKHIGRYDIKALIGQGGMSAVYLGYDPRSMREVAVKILPPYYLHAPKFRERFEREALPIAILEHPAIVPVYDMGEDDGQPYIVMRYMSGGSLSDKLKRGPILLREALDMYIRLAPALDTAHTRGIIHRDVKPDNLLFDKYDNVYLSDFGLVRLKETIGFANISDGSIMGTPAYMSPEQIQGDREIDGRSDIYSMGVVLYQMLCGKIPFEGSTAASIMMMHLISPVPQVCEQNPSLPIAIQKVLETAMAKDPNDRYQTAVDLAKAIQAVTSGVYKKLSVPIPGSPPEKQPTQQASNTFPVKTPPLGIATPAQAFSLNNGMKTPPTGVPKQAAVTPEPLARTPSPSQFPLSSSLPSPVPIQERQRPSVPMWLWVSAASLVVILSLVLYQWVQGGYPFSAPQSAASNAPVSLGQADKLAFLNASEIWTSNLDGSDLVQLTMDGAAKSNLRWSPDGKSVLYTSQNCVRAVSLLAKTVETVACFLGMQTIDAFDISPDGQDVALGLAQSELYVLPYDQLSHLGPDSSPIDLPPLASCSHYAPYHVTGSLKSANWSLVDGQIALLTSRIENGISQDVASIVDFNLCVASPPIVKELLPTYFLFTLPGYYDHPEISSLSLNNQNQLLLNGLSNKAGFGDLQLLNLEQNHSQAVAPNGACCYRDAFWSPDGKYLFYTYQPQDGGEINLYYVRFDELGQPGIQVASLSFPAGFFASDLTSLEPALRIAH